MTENTPIVTVRAQATVEAEPEIARLSVVVIAYDSDRRTTLTRLSARNDQVLTVIRSYGAAIEKVETSGASVVPELAGKRGERVRRYRGSIRVQLDVCDLSVVGEVTARLADLEQTAVGELRWLLRPASPVYERARRDAAKAAVARAKEYASAVGATLTGVLELADQGLATHFSGGERVRGMAAMAMDEDALPPLDLEPVTQVVEASVEGRFTMTQPDQL